MEHLSLAMEHQDQEQQDQQLHGEEIKCKSFAAKDIAKET
jgi:hypothetical protein